MNRTGLILVSAVVLALVAIVATGPRSSESRVIPSAVAPTVSRDGSLTMTARLSHPFIAPGSQDVFLSVDVRGVEVPGQRRAPVNLAMVIDRSGSMSGFKLTQAKLAASQLVGQLTAEDRLTIVHYGSDVKSLEALYATAENKARMLSYIDGIWDDGGTNIGEALSTARELLLRNKGEFRTNRLILVSDGQPTEGVTDFAGLEGIAREIRSQGVSVSSLGVGDDFNENLMQSLAEVGAGAYGYLQDASQLGGIFQKDLNAAGTQVARGVSLTVRAPRGTRLQQVLGYSQVSRVTSGETELVTVALPDFSAAQQERVVMQLTVQGSNEGQTVEVGTLSLDYTDLLKNGEGHGLARLSAMTSGNTEIVAKNRDKDAVVFATRARAAQNAQQAADKLSSGDRPAAEALLQQNQVLFDEAGSIAGLDAIKEDVQAQGELRENARKARSEDDLKTYKKVVNTKARRDYGLMGSTY